MVQAGSGLKPQSITQARVELKKAREALLEAQRLHDEAQQALELELKNAETVSKEELLETVKDEVETAREVEEKLEEFEEVCLFGWLSRFDTAAADDAAADDDGDDLSLIHI